MSKGTTKTHGVKVKKNVDLAKHMGTPDYDANRAIMHNLVRYGQSARSSIKEPNSKRYIDHPEEYVVATEFLTMWESDLKRFYEDALIPYEAALKALDFNVKDELDLYNRFRDDCEITGALKLCQNYAKQAAAVIEHKKDFNIPHYLDKYCQEHYQRSQTDARHRVKDLADATATPFEYRIALQLSLEVAINAYADFGGDVKKVKSWRAEFEAATNGLKDVVVEHWNAIAQAMVLPNDRYTSSEGEAIRNSAATAFKKSSKKKASQIILRTSIFSEEFYRMTGLTSGSFYKRMPIFVVTEGKKDSVLHFGFYEESNDSDASDVRIVYEQLMPPLSLGKELDQQAQAAAEESEARAAADKLAQQAAQEAAVEEEVEDFAAAAQAEVAEALRQAQEMQEKALADAQKMMGN